MVYALTWGRHLIRFPCQKLRTIILTTSSSHAVKTDRPTVQTLIFKNLILFYELHKSQLLAPNPQTQAACQKSLRSSDSVLKFPKGVHYTLHFFTHMRCKFHYQTDDIIFIQMHFFKNQVIIIILSAYIQFEKKLSQGVLNP